MNIREKTVKLDWLNTMQCRLTAMADEMDASGTPALEAMADHIDCINDEVQFQIDQILEAGPIVTYRGGQMKVYAGDRNQ